MELLPKIHLHTQIYIDHKILKQYLRSVTCHIIQKVKICLVIRIFPAWVATVQPSARWLCILLHPDQEIRSRLSMSKEIKPSI